MKLLITFLLTSVVLSAHPHIFIDIYPKINIENSRATSLSIEWKFDQMTSSVLIMDYDKNKDGKFSKKETAKAKKNAMRIFKKYDYCLKIMKGDRNIKIQKLKNFKVSIDELDRIVYSFDLVCNFDPKGTILLFYYGDYYIAFMLKKTIVQPLNKNLDFSIRKVDNARYFGYAMTIKDMR